MTEETIYQLTKMYLEEIDKEQDKFVMTKKQLINFCIKMMKVIKNIENYMGGDYERIRENQDISF